MNLQGLKLKRTLPHLHTGSELLATGGCPLRRVTDPTVILWEWLMEGSDPWSLQLLKY